MITENIIDNFFKNRNHNKIIGREASLNSAVMVLFCEVAGKLYVLFEKRAKGIKQGGEISFPGGKRDKEDNSFLHTALRETYEEIGLLQERITDVKKYGTLVIPTGVIVEACVGYVKNFSLDELCLNEKEVERIILVPLDYFFENNPKTEYVTVENEPFYINDKGEKIDFPAKKWQLPERYSKAWQGKPRRLLFYLYNNDVIWGITAEIMYSVSKELRNLKK